jgi:hypothetical protein
VKFVGDDSTATRQLTGDEDGQPRLKLSAVSIYNARRNFDLAASCFHPLMRAVRIRGGKGKEQDNDRPAVAAFVHKRLCRDDSAEI